MSGKRVPQRVRRDACSARLELQPPAYVGRREAAAALREEERLALPAVQRRPGACQIAVERAPGVLADRDDPRAAPLPLYAHLLGVGVRAGGVEVDELLGAQARRVGELEHGAVAEVERRGPRDALEQLHDLVRLQHLRQVGVLLRARHQLRRVGVDLPALDEVAVEGADGGQLAGDGGLGGAALAQHGGEAAQLPVRERGGLQPASGRPFAKLREVDAVGPPSLLPHTSAALPVVEGAERRAPTSLRGCGCVFRQHAGRTGGDTRSAHGGGADRRSGQAAGALAPDPGPERRLDHVVRGPAQARAGGVHRHALHSTHRPPDLAGRARLGGGPDRRDRPLTYYGQPYLQRRAVPHSGPDAALAPCVACPGPPPPEPSTTVPTAPRTWSSRWSGRLPARSPGPSCCAAPSARSSRRACTRRPTWTPTTRSWTAARPSCMWRTCSWPRRTWQRRSTPSWARCTPGRSCPRTSDPAASGDIDGGPDGNLVVELDHVRDRHPDAAVRGGGAERVGLVRAVDSGAVVDAEPPRLQRVLGHAARHHRARQLAGPVAVRHAPGRIHRLVLDVIHAGGGVEADGAYGDGVLLDQVQPLVVAQLEAGAVDDQQGLILVGQLGLGDLRLDDPRGRPDAA